MTPETVLDVFIALDESLREIGHIRPGFHSTHRMFRYALCYQTSMLLYIALQNNEHAKTAMMLLQGLRLVDAYRI